MTFLHKINLLGLEGLISYWILVIGFKMILEYVFVMTCSLIPVWSDESQISQKLM